MACVALGGGPSPLRDGEHEAAPVQWVRVGSHDTEVRVDLPVGVLYGTEMNAVEERRLKGLLKDVLVEVLEERRDLLREALRESLEDIALLRAIKQGEKSRLVGRDVVFKLLEGDA